MDQQRDVQPAASAAPYYPYQAAPYPPQPARRPSLMRVFSDIIRLLLRRLVYLLMRLWRPFRAYAGFILLTLGLLGVIGWMAVQLWAPQPGIAPDPRVAMLPPSPAVENYITGRRTYNADLMWDSYSSDYQYSQLQSGNTKDIMKKAALAEQRVGLQYRNIQYIGAVQRTDGGHLYYYSIDISAGGQSVRVPLVFFSNSEERIERIYSPLDSIAQQASQ